MSDRAGPGATPSSDGPTPDGSGAGAKAEGGASRDAEHDLQAVLDGVAERLDEVLAVPDAARPDDAAEAHDGQAVQASPPRVHGAAEVQEGAVADDPARTDEAEQRLRAARERMTERHAAAREEERASANRAGAARRGVSWVGIGLVAVAAVAASAIVWLR